MPRDYERNVIYNGKMGIGTVKCKYRYNEERYTLGAKGAKNSIKRLKNRCVLNKNQCTHPICNHKNCNLPKRR